MKMWLGVMAVVFGDPLEHFHLEQPHWGLKKAWGLPEIQVV